jgi:PemK-like, MazF-like toxin of type II toxin-antitoxin system
MAPRYYALPDVGDIVWCWFPHEGFAKPRPKPRPALVVDVGALRGTPAAEVIYATSQKLDRIYPGEFAITPADGGAYALSGLSYPTKFNTRRSVFLPYNDTWFGPAPGAPYGQTPKLGVLHPGLLPRLAAAARRRRS